MFARLLPDGATYHWLFETTMMEAEVVMGSGGYPSNLEFTEQGLKKANKFFASFLFLRFKFSGVADQMSYVHVLVQLGNGFVDQD